jgi:hypothetical protein
MDRMIINLHDENGLLATHVPLISRRRPNIFKRTFIRFVCFQQKVIFVLIANARVVEGLFLLPNVGNTDQYKVHIKLVRAKLYNYDRIIDKIFKADFSKSELYSRALQKIFKNFHTHKIYRVPIHRVCVQVH